MVHPFVSSYFCHDDSNAAHLHAMQNKHQDADRLKSHTFDDRASGEFRIDLSPTHHSCGVSLLYKQHRRSSLSFLVLWLQVNIIR